MTVESYFFEEQIAKFQIQFMAVFEGLMYRTGKRGDNKTQLHPVPIVYGSRDRVTASIMGDNTQNKSLKLPTMSAYMTQLDISTERMKGQGTERRSTYLPRGGMLPDDIKVVRQYMPSPYDMTMELAIYSSNMNQHRQILEQILVFFDPLIQIQKNDTAFDWTRITTVELTNLAFDENYPAGIDKRAIVSTLTFKVPIWIGVPSDVKSNFINQVFARIITAESGDTIDEIIGDISGILDPYDLLVDGSQIESTQIGESCDDDSEEPDISPPEDC